LDADKAERFCKRNFRPDPDSPFLTAAKTISLVCDGASGRDSQKGCFRTQLIAARRATSQWSCDLRTDFIQHEVQTPKCSGPFKFYRASMDCGIGVEGASGTSGPTNEVRRRMDERKIDFASPFLCQDARFLTVVPYFSLYFCCSDTQVVNGGTSLPTGLACVWVWSGTWPLLLRHRPTRKILPPLLRLLGCWCTTPFCATTRRKWRSCCG